MIIGISGKMRSGKDTAADIIRSWSDGWQVKRYADIIKDVTCLILGCSKSDPEDIDFKNMPLDKSWQRANNRIMTPRLFMQLLGTDFGRNMIHPNIWVNSLFADYNPDCKWIITDVRFPNEADAILERGGLLIRVERNKSPKELHPSETALDDYPFEHIIQNNGTREDYHVKVTKIVNQYLQANRDKIFRLGSNDPMSERTFKNI